MAIEDPDNEGEEIDLTDDSLTEEDLFSAGDVEPEVVAGAGRTGCDASELKRVETENAELKDRLARRQADFENYRKRVERERSETYNRVVADVARSSCRCGQSETSVGGRGVGRKPSESDEFRHFLSGVDLINKHSMACSTRSASSRCGRW